MERLILLEFVYVSTLYSLAYVKGASEPLLLVIFYALSFIQSAWHSFLRVSYGVLASVETKLHLLLCSA